MSVPPGNANAPAGDRGGCELTKIATRSHTRESKSIRFFHPEKESVVAGYLAELGFKGFPASLPPASIFTSHYRVIYACALNIHAAGREVNSISINDELLRLGLDKQLGEDIPQGWELWSAFADKSFIFNAPAAVQCLRDIESAAHDRAAHDVLTKAAEGEMDRTEVLEQLHAIQDLAAHKGELPAIVDAHAFCNNPPQKPKELIEGLLHRGAKLVLGGGSKSFKTWTLMQMAVGVACGRPFLQFPCKQGKVLFVNLEIQDAFFAERLMAIQIAREVIVPRGQMDVLNLRGYAADAATLLPKITQKATNRDYSLIILDPLYKLLGARDENASTDMAELLNAVEKVAVETGAAIAFGSHFAKGNASGKESMDRISGSGVFARDPDSILTMTRHEEDDCFTVEMTLRNHPPQDPFVVRREHPLMVVDSELDPTKLKQVVGRGTIHTAEDVFNLLTEMTTSEWQKVCEKEGISPRTFQRRRGELEKSGRIFRSKIDQKWSRKS